MKLKFLLCLLLLAANIHAQRPNIIFILADDLGYGDLGVYGQKMIRTPHLDRLAKGGMWFTRFYAGTSVCAPSRASLMTGKHTGHAPVRGNVGMEPEGQYPIADSTFTMAEMLQQAGYTTGAFGKWGLGGPGSEGVPEKQGFNRFFGYNCQTLAHNYFPDHLWDNDKLVPVANTPASQQQYAPDLIQAKAMEFMDANAKNPFFLFLTYTLPHAGLQLPAGDPDFEAYKKLLGETPQPITAGWAGKGYQPQAYPRATYAAMVTRLDRYVGEVMAKLKALGIDKNTLVIFTSDNGPHREGGYQPEWFNSNGGLRGIKRDLYEGGIRVPLIAHWPAAIKAGTVNKTVGAFWDFLPTFAALSGAQVPEGIDGVSLVPTLTGKGVQQQPAYRYWEFHENGGRQAVLMGRWKGVRLEVNNNPEGPIALYDLDKDPKEAADISASHPEIVLQMAAIMRQAHIEHPAFPLTTGKPAPVKSRH